MTTPSTVIVFVPGITGSELYYVMPILNTKHNAWPDLINPIHAYKGIGNLYEVTSDEKIRVGGLVREYSLAVASAPAYGPLIDYMKGANNFASGKEFKTFTYNTETRESGTPVEVSDQLFYMVPYDWRQDNLKSAQWLYDGISHLDNAYRAKGQPYKLYLVGHSMGGLVSRAMLEGGIASPETPWWDNLQMLITLGTPHLGAPMALAPAIELMGDTLGLRSGIGGLVNMAMSLATERATGLRVEVVELFDKFLKHIVNNSAFPSTYELLPPNLPSPNQQLFVQGEKPEDGKLYDIYDAAQTAFRKALTTRGLNTANLDQAMNFFSRLSYTAPPPKPYHCFAGTGGDTVANAGTGRAFTFDGDYGFKAVTHKSSGDGVVPEASAKFETNTSDNVKRHEFENYSHFHIGGSDMKKMPDAIIAMLELAGVKALKPEMATAVT